MPDKDGLVRRVIVRPHKQKGKTMTETPREWAITELVLIKAINTKDEPELNTDTQLVPVAQEPLSEEELSFW